MARIDERVQRAERAHLVATFTRRLAKVDGVDPQG